jgi:hypothetical protein
MLLHKSTIFRPPKVHFNDEQSITYYVYPDRSTVTVWYQYVIGSLGVHVLPGVSHPEDRVIKWHTLKIRLYSSDDTGFL